MTANVCQLPVAPVDNKAASDDQSEHIRILLPFTSCLPSSSSAKRFQWESKRIRKIYKKINIATFCLPYASLSADLLLTWSLCPLPPSSSEDCHSQPQTGGGDSIPASDTTMNLVGRSDISNLFLANQTPAFFYY